MSEGLHKYRWHYANDVLTIDVDGYASVVTISGDIAELLVQTISSLCEVSANALLAGLFSAGIAASLGAVGVSESGGRAHG